MHQHLHLDINLHLHQYLCLNSHIYEFASTIDSQAAGLQGHECGLVFVTDGAVDGLHLHLQINLHIYALEQR